jgi:hypothetical protein
LNDVNAFRKIKLLKESLSLLFLALLSPVQAQQSSLTYDPPGNLTAVSKSFVGAPTITTPPQPQLLETNSPVTLSVIATGAGLSFQWLSNGVPIVGATGDSLVLANLPFVNSTNFSVIVSNVSGVVTSTPAALWTDSNGNGIPDWWEMEYFGNLNQTAEGDFDGDGVDNLDEYLEGTNPTNAASYDPRLYLSGFHGTATVSPVQPFYTMGQVVTLTAIPDPGQSFTSWSGSISGTKPNVSVIMDGHKTITANFGLSLPVALDNANLVWTTGGDAPWFGQTEFSDDGNGAAQSGPVICPVGSGGPGDWVSQQSWLEAEANLSQPEQLSFWWNVSSQPTNGCTFSVDGTVYASISGNGRGWQYVQTDLSSGIHILSWDYNQYNSDNPTNVSYSDAAWVDEVMLALNITQANAPLLAIDLTSTNTVLISWPAPSTGFRLQQNSTLSSASWASVTNAINVVGGQNQVTISPASSSLFYRLIYP